MDSCLARVQFVSAVWRTEDRAEFVRAMRRCCRARSAVQCNDITVVNSIVTQPRASNGRVNCDGAEIRTLYVEPATLCRPLQCQSQREHRVAGGHAEMYIANYNWISALSLQRWINMTHLTAVDSAFSAKRHATRYAFETRRSPLLQWSRPER